MAKPVNRVTFIIWVIAVMVPFVNLIQVFVTFATLKFAPDLTVLITRGFFLVVTGSLEPIGMLVGIGALVEIADKILWHLEQHSPRV